MNDNIIKIPKIFISYSWTKGNEVLDIAERLASLGIEVVFDKWDLKEGQDKYKFMETCVTDEDIDRVLILSDRAYSEKADKRAGGVGDETTIISSEVYGRATQSKFIPIVLELDEKGNPFLPVYIKSRIYINLVESNEDYESEFEKLVRNIYEKPLFKRPALGKAPDWLFDEDISYISIKNTIKELKKINSSDFIKYKSANKKILDEFLKKIIEVNDISMGKDLLEKIDELKILRDSYINYLEYIISEGILVSEIITTFFEDIYNNAYDLKGRTSYRDSDIESIDFFIWETFIATISLLLHYENYSNIYSILHHTYFLKEHVLFDSNLKEFSYFKFRKYFKTIENVYKPKSENPRFYTLAGEILVKREMKPYLTQTSIANADLILFQLSKTVDPNDEFSNFWFPTCYPYCNINKMFWIKLKSIKFCHQIMPLFGVDNLDSLKITIDKCRFSQSIKYQNSFDAALEITNIIKIEEIGSLY